MVLIKTDRKLYLNLRVTNFGHILSVLRLKLTLPRHYNGRIARDRQALVIEKGLRDVVIRVGAVALRRPKEMDDECTFDFDFFLSPASFRNVAKEAQLDDFAYFLRPKTTPTDRCPPKPSDLDRNFPITPFEHEEVSVWINVYQPTGKKETSSSKADDPLYERLLREEPKKSPEKEVLPEVISLSPDDPLKNVEQTILLDPESSLEVVGEVRTSKKRRRRRRVLRKKPVSKDFFKKRLPVRRKKNVPGLVIELSQGEKSIVTLSGDDESDDESLSPVLHPTARGPEEVDDEED